MAAGECERITVQMVTQSSPSPVISFTECVSQDAHVSRITDADSEHVSRVLQNVHIPPRLMEDFLELARENTEKDLETCGILGAFLCDNVVGGPENGPTLFGILRRCFLT